MNKEFLLKLDQEQTNKIHIELISLDYNDRPLQIISGLATGGSINVDGKSAVRRTCSINLTAAATSVITDIYWCFKHKFKVRIGKENYIDSTQPPIIWQDMGTYIISSFSKSYTTSNITISIQGKDKMCLLNGEISGHLFADVDFGEEEIIDDDGIITKYKIPIQTIIRKAVSQIGGEKEENIIINDLEQNGYELWEYRGNSPMYYFKEVNTGTIKYISLEDIEVKEGEQVKKVSELSKFYSMNSIDPSYNNSKNLSKVQLDDGFYYYVIQIVPEAAAGYYQTPLVYNAELIIKAGETITALLDKLVSMLGSFEYYYDIYGRFIFQKKNNYIQELFSTSTGALSTATMYNNMYSYYFNDRKLFTSISGNPNINNIKNDFSVWGTRTNGNSAINIHARCAIDNKPKEYNSPWDRYIKTKCYESNRQYYLKQKNNDLINYLTKYEKAELFVNLEHLAQFDMPIIKLLQENYSYLVQKIKKDNQEFLLVQETNKENIEIEIHEGFDQYILTFLNNYNLLIYTFIPKESRKYSIQSVDWREIIYQMAIDYRAHNYDSDFLLKIREFNPQIYPTGYTGYEQYYIDIEGFWRQLYSPEVNEQLDGIEYYNLEEDSKYYYWNKLIRLDPTALNFWFEFIDTFGELNKFSVKEIGARSKVLNEKTITSIYYSEIPEIQFKIGNEEKEANTAYTLLQISPDNEELFAKSSRGISAIDKINELIINHTAHSQSINISCIPIYYLQPNTRIHITDDEYGGDYTLTNLSYNLSHGGTMSLSMTKIFKQFI